MVFFFQSYNITVFLRFFNLNHVVMRRNYLFIISCYRNSTLSIAMCFGNLKHNVSFNWYFSFQPRYLVLVYDIYYDPFLTITFLFMILVCMSLFVSLMFSEWIYLISLFVSFIQFVNLRDLISLFHCVVLYSVRSIEWSSSTV